LVPRETGRWVRWTRKKSSNESSSGHERDDEWSEVTRGERYVIRTTAEEANGAYSMLEVVADPRNGVPMHVHDNEEEHFIILEGKALIANSWRLKMDERAAAVLRKPPFRKIEWLDRDIAVERRSDGVIVLKSRIPL
jgi:hypothetical protein